MLHPNDSQSSDVARLFCVLGQKIFLRSLPPVNKNYGVYLKWKIGAKVRKKQTQNIYCSYFVLFWR